MTVVCISALILTLVAWWRVARVLPAEPIIDSWPALLLVRPADELSPRELHAIETPIDYAGAIDHVVVGARQPALTTVRWLHSDPCTANRKLGHLQRALSTLSTRPRLIVSADADVLVDGALLRGLVLASQRAPMVFAPPMPVAAPGHRSSRALFCHTLHHFRCLFALDGSSVCGKAMVLGARAQAELARLDDCVAEDLRLAQRLGDGGVAIAATPAHILPSPGMPRFVRWMQTLRAHKPLAFLAVPLLVAPLPWLTLAMCIGALPIGWWLALTAARAGLARTLDRDAWWWFGAGEALLLASFALALVRRTIIWRDRALTVASGGLILDARLAFGDKRRA